MGHPHPRRVGEHLDRSPGSHATDTFQCLRNLPKASPQWFRLGLPAEAGVLTVAGQRRNFTCFPNIQDLNVSPQPFTTWVVVQGPVQAHATPRKRAGHN
jgi:hypothetical protein